MKYAVIDIGTNSTRLYVCEAVGKAQSTIIKKLSTTRLGEGINSSNIMAEIPMARTVKCVTEFVNNARVLGAGQIFIYATAMVRESANKAEFAERIFEQTNISLDIIPGELEGKIAFIGATSGESGCAVIDIGGGSTEVVSSNGGFKALSQKIGGVRLKERFYSESGIVDVDEVKAYVTKNFIASYAPVVADCKKLIGVSGTPTTIASLVQNSKTYLPELVQGYVLTSKTFNGELSRLAAMTTAERIEYSGDFAPRADIIVYAGCILSSFLEYYGFDAITVSDRDSLEGYLEYKLS